MKMDAINRCKKAIRKQRKMKKSVNKGDTAVVSRRSDKSNGRCPAPLPASLSGNDCCCRPANENQQARGRDDDVSTAALTNRFRSSVSITLVAAAATAETTDVGTKTAAVVFDGQHDGLTPDTTAATSAADDDSDGDSSGEKGSGGGGGGARKDRKPLPLVFDRSNNDSSSDASEDTKEMAGSDKCVYLGEKETLRSFWDKCLYECFKSKRCVAGEKPKRKYRKKPKVQKPPPTKKRKQLDAPFSCIDTRGIAAVTRTVDYLNRYEMLLYMDPLANCATPMQKKDFEMAFRMVKPSDIFALTEDNNNNNDDSTDYINSDTDQEEVYDN